MDANERECPGMRLLRNDLALVGTQSRFGILRHALAVTLFCSSLSGADSLTRKFSVTSNGQAKTEIVVEGDQPASPLADGSLGIGSLKGGLRQ